MAGPRGSRYYDVFLDYEVSLKSRKNSEHLNESLILLLKSIEKHGSLISAAREMKISYRKAWGDLQKAEAFLGFPLVEKQRGGTAGGESRLTADGAELVQAFRELHHEIDGAIHKITRKFFHALNHQENAGEHAD